MWIASKLGFYSIVEKEVDQYHVRGRIAQDLENLREAAKIREPVQSWPQADYRFRLIVNGRQLHKIMRALEAEIDYPNFKSEIAKWDDQREKLTAYHRVWHTMASLQPDV